MAKGEIVAVRRVNGEKLTMSRDVAGQEIVALLVKTQIDMLHKATKERDSRLSRVSKWEDFTAALERKHILLAPFCGDITCEDNIKKDSRIEEETDAKAPAMGAKSLCIPFNPPCEPLKSSEPCIHPECKNKPKFITLFGRSY
ncbi:hypothetical protein O0L34_g10982 [Tuta absoluta]|nr:hypothetical protein O0L34_g10982 [Tuta absoluta]